MPLKLVAPREGWSPNWTIRGTYLGRYVNRSAGTPKRAIALKQLANIQEQIERGEFSEPGDPTFAGAVAAYVKAGGTDSTSPARRREKKAVLRKLLEYFGEKPLKKINQQAINAAAAALYPAASAATRNRSVYTPVSAVCRQAGAAIGDLRRPKGSGGNKQTAWLWPEQADALFEAAGKLNKEFETLLIVLTYTGMRLSEALNLQWNDVRLEDGYAYVPDTKNNDPRAVFLPSVAVAAIANLARKSDRADRVFRYSKSGHIYSLLRVAAIKAGVNLPERSAFHILRHTYATWMRRYAGADETTLIATGAWKDAKSVKRYTHAVVSEESKRAALLPTPKRKVV